MTLRMVPLPTIPVPEGMPAPNEETCWITPGLVPSTNPMVHCTFQKGHAGLHTWERCAHHARGLRCKRKLGHEKTHLYGTEPWAPGFPTKPAA